MSDGMNQVQATPVFLLCTNSPVYKRFAMESCVVKVSPQQVGPIYTRTHTLSSMIRWNTFTQNMFLLFTLNVVTSFIFALLSLHIIYKMECCTRKKLSLFLFTFC